MTVVVEPPRWSLQDFERELAVREVSTLLQTSAAWEGVHILAGPPAARRLKSARRRLAFASSVAGVETAQFQLERAVRSSHRKVTSHALHGLHPYKGKFYPQLARSLINICGLEPGMRLLDPFAGCGTSVLEAALVGVRGTGIDANPLGALVSQTKLELLGTPVSEVRKCLARLDPQPQRRSHPDAKYLQRWFPPGNYKALTSLLEAIDRIEFRPARHGARVALSSVLREASHQDPRQIRVYRRPPEEKIPSLGALFKRALAELLDDLENVQETPEFSLSRLRRTHSRVFRGDARHLTACLPSRIEQVDAVVTSPPYAMALPYIDTDRLSLRALEMLDTNQQAAEARLIGNREITERARRELEEQIHSATWLPDQLDEILDETLAVAAGPDAGFRKRRTPALLFQYFRDMRQVLGQLKQITRPQGPIVIVVGDNRVAGTGKNQARVPTADILAELGERQGLRLEDRLSKRLTSFGAPDTIHQRNAMGQESVLFFRRVK